MDAEAAPQAWSPRPPHSQSLPAGAARPPAGATGLGAGPHWPPTGPAPAPSEPRGGSPAAASTQRALAGLVALLGVCAAPSPALQAGAAAELPGRSASADRSAVEPVAAARRSQTMQGAVNQAILRGVNGLLRAQQLDGSWRYLQDHYTAGSTAMICYTLMKCGVARDHPSIERGIEFVLQHPPEHVYSAGTQLQALALHDPERHRAMIESIVEQLDDWEANGWAYPVHHSTEVDISNTQYALMGLRAARRAGVEVQDKLFRSAAKATLRHREKRPKRDAGVGFGYRIGSDPTGAMTAAGITVLAIASEQLEKRVTGYEEAIAEGLVWLEREFSIARNPRPARDANAEFDPQDRWWLYYLYGVERVSGILGLDRIGRHDWYSLGAQRLLEHQNDQGLWMPLHGGDAAQELADTCFALLFLSRASGATTGQSFAGRRPSAKSDELGDVLVLGAGDAPWRVWVQGYGPGVVDEYLWPDEGGLRIAEVRWEQLNDAGEVGEVLDRQAGVEDRDASLVRFPTELRFSQRGSHLVRAAVDFRLPDGSVDTRYSSPVDLVTEFVDRPHLIDYARESRTNLLVGVKKEIRVSSQLNGTWPARRAVDGRQALGWVSRDDDPKPWIEIELDDAVRADTLRLSRAHEPWSTGPWRTGRISRVAIAIDGGKPFEVELIDDDWVKTVIPLPKRTKVDSIAVRVREVTGVHPDHPDYAGVGFGEIELIDSKR